MPKGIRINSVQPYTTISPRRALHAAGSAEGVLHGKVVRQANPACSLPQTTTNPNGQFCSDNAWPQRIFKTISDPSDPNYNPNQLQVATCAKIACDNNLDVTQAIPGPQQYIYDNSTGANYLLNNDASCCVANPPQIWTKPATIMWHPGDTYRGIAGTITPGTVICSDASGSRIWSIAPRDVDILACFKGSSNAAIARQIQCNLGLRSDCNTTAAPSTVAPAKTTSAAINVLPTINPAITLNPAGQATTSQAIHILPTIDPAVPINTPSHKHDAQIPSSTSLGIATTAAGALSTVAAYLAPTPTATIAATASGVAVESLLATAVGAGLGGCVVGIAAYAGYKFCQTLKKEPFQNSGHSLEEAQQFVNKAFSDEEPRYAELQSNEHIYETVEQTKKEAQ